MTANNSDCVKLHSVESLVKKNAVITINTAPKKYEYAVTERLEGYFLKTGACKFSSQKINIRKFLPSTSKRYVKVMINSSMQKQVQHAKIKYEGLLRKAKVL